MYSELWMMGKLCYTVFIIADLQFDYELDISMRS